MPEQDTSTPTIDRDDLDRWWRRHSELDQLVNNLVEAVARAKPEPAGSALEELAEAMEVHFTVEEELYFPVIENLSERHLPVLQHARLAHLKLRSQLAELRERLGEGEMPAAQKVLAALLGRFRSHEEAEAALIQELLRAEVKGSA